MRPRPLRAVARRTGLLAAALAGAVPGAMAQGVPVAAVFSATEAEQQPRFVFPAKDRQLQRDLDRVLGQQPFRRLVRNNQLSVALVDLSTPGQVRYAGVQDDRMRYAASLPKIGILLGVFAEVDHGTIEYTPALRGKLERMIRRSENAVSTELIELVGFRAIEAALRDPRYQLYSPSRNGGLWVGRDYGGGIGVWRRDPLHKISHGATARQVARFFVMLERGELVSPDASAEMKSILGDPELHHKFVLGLDQRPNSKIYRKSGTWRQFHADAALVERDGRKYVAVALLESRSATGVFADLIVRLDDVVHTARPPSQRSATE